MHGKDLGGDLADLWLCQKGCLQLQLPPNGFMANTANIQTTLSPQARILECMGLSAQVGVKDNKHKHITYITFRPLCIYK